LGGSGDITGELEVTGKVTAKDDLLVEKSATIVADVFAQSNVAVSGRITDKTGDVGPVGAIFMFPVQIQDLEARGFLVCDGSAYDREAYADLYSVISTTYGGAGYGGGGTTFNVPDYRGYFLRGCDDSRASSMAQPQGQSTALPNQNFTTDVTEHSHTYADSYQEYVEETYAEGDGCGDSGWTREQTRTTTSGGAHNHTVTGGGDAETRPQNYAIVYAIKF
jgi:microcystin-dependent protein